MDNVISEECIAETAAYDVWLATRYAESSADQDAAHYGAAF
jgi:hypothetical protein